MLNSNFIKPILLSLFSLVQVCFGQEKINYSIEKSIVAGDIIRTTFSDTAKINLYQGNGRFGCSYGSLGLHNNPNNTKNTNKYGQTEYMHISHWIRAKFNGDYLIPLLKIYWKDERAVVKNYSQHQSFYNGTLKTNFQYDNNKLSVETWSDAVDRDVTGIIINVVGQASDIIIDPLQNLEVHYYQNILQQSKIIKHNNSYEVKQTCLNKTSSLFIQTNDSVTIKDNQLVVKLHPGKNTFLISYNKPVQTSCELSLSRSQKWWNNTWNSTGNLLLPDKQAQEIWVRSMAYILSSCNDDKLGLPPPMGLTGNIWPFAFPQDLSFIHSVLLTTGHLNIAKSWVEYWAERVQGMKDFTKRLYGVDGIACPWVFPYGVFKDFYDPSPPNRFNFEIHNSGYLCRMAYETSKYVNDTAWTNKNVVELIKQTALFYKNIITKDPDGLWHLYVKPSMGQDELAEPDQKDYLCALYSAEYCFQKAIEFNLDTDGVYKTILSDGLAFQSLLSFKGFYFRDARSRDTAFGNQKHPVQLNALGLLPVDNEVTQPSLEAYKQRYDIAKDAKKPIFFGWTLGEFLLAGSRVGDVNGWQKDWDNLRKADYIDADFITLYEGTSGYNTTFYITTHGLVVQSLINNLVSDWFGSLEIAKCNSWKGKIYLNKIFSLLGVYVSGEIYNTNASLNLTGWKDCQLTLCGKMFDIKKDEVLHVTINNGHLLTTN